MSKRCPLFQYYHGVQHPQPSTCLMQVKPLKTGPLEKATQTEGRCHPILGGRHCVTEFEAWCQDHQKTYKPAGFAWATECGDPRYRNAIFTPQECGPGTRNNTLPGMNDMNQSANRRTRNRNNSSPLVSFLDSIVKEKDGVMREHHRDQFNVKQHQFNVKQHQFNVKQHQFNVKQRQFNVTEHQFQGQYQPSLHAHVTPGSGRAPGRHRRNIRKTQPTASSSSDETSEPETRRRASYKRRRDSSRNMNTNNNNNSHVPVSAVNNNNSHVPVSAVNNNNSHVPVSAVNNNNSHVPVSAVNK
ncbi:hypothetical protein BsWGS_04069 [Bradybaena similaris]